MVKVYDGKSTGSPHPPLNLCLLVILWRLRVLVLRFLCDFLVRRFVKKCVKTNQFIYVLIYIYILYYNRQSMI